MLWCVSRERRLRVEGKDDDDEGARSSRLASVPAKTMKTAVIDRGGACARHRCARIGLSRI